MMKKLYILIAAFLLILPSSAASAQNQEDAIMIWSTTTIHKTFGKENNWTVGILSEYRHNFHEGVAKMSQYFVRPSVAYKVLPWMKLQYQMDFAAHGSKGFQWRFIPEITFSHKVGDFTFAYRQRAMTTWNVKGGTNSTVLRSRAKIDYRIPKSPVTAHFAFEPYWCDFGNAVSNGFAWFQKARWYAGVNIKLAEHLYFMPQYICQAYHNHKGRYDRRTYDDHVIYITLSVKL
jgi:hypothetical protein